jgi:hypothetical protein
VKPTQQNLPQFKDFMIYRDNPDTILIYGYADTFWQPLGEKEIELTAHSSVEIR